MAEYIYTPLYLRLANVSGVWPRHKTAEDFLNGDIGAASRLILFRVTEEGIDYWLDLVHQAKYDEAVHLMSKYIYFVPEEWR